MLVQRNVDDAIGRLGFYIELGVFLQALQIVGRWIFDQIHITGQQRSDACRRVADGAIRYLVPGRRLAPIVRVTLEDDLGAALP